MTPPVLEKIYTLEEAAERLRLNKNALARIARRTGNCSIFGRSVLFSDSDLLAIWQGMRVEPTRSVETVKSTLKSEREIQQRAKEFLAKKPKAPRVN